MSDQVTAMMETINNNFLCLMSMVFGLNCRLNAQETLIREIHEKLCGNEADQVSSEEVEEESKEEEQEVENHDEEKFQADLSMMARFVSSIVAPEEDPEIDDEKKEVPPEINDKEIICYDCKAVFRRGTGEFTRHLLNTRCRPYACNVCKKLFKKKSNMETHKLTHSEFEMKCSECGAVFKCDQYLKNHQKRVHKMVFTETDDQPSAKRRKIALSSPPPIATTSSSSASTSHQGNFDQASFDSFMSQIMLSNASNDSE